ncbi:hypothetical protein HDU67_007311 [Dinochytrium kinnereticum]|nr:hypothetical protein HDU67_007311 [Dinochytrium kinnereticum]
MPSSFTVTLRTMPWSLYVVAAAVVSWVHGKILLALEDLILSILRLGPVPQHIAFIMDGNRRFAKGKGMVIQKGHQEGFAKLENTLDWCLRLGVKVVSVYAFSTENFNRDPGEVGMLMDLARDKFEDFATKSEVIEKYGIAVKVLGNVSLLPPEVQEAASRAVLMTRNNSGAILNVCIPYTSREEITLAVNSVLKGVESGPLTSSDITPSLIERSLYTGPLPPLDIMIRTSGEIRLSDFLLWQGSQDCHIHYVDAFWPDFSLWDALPALHSFQSHYRPDRRRCDEDWKAAVDEFIKDLDKTRDETAVALALNA